MKHVLDQALQQGGPDLFLLCQDKINGVKHDILREKLGMDQSHTTAKPNSEAEIFYRQYAPTSATSSSVLQKRPAPVQYMSQRTLTTVTTGGQKSYAPLPSAKAASIASNPGTASYYVTYLDAGTLQRVEDGLRIEPGNEFTTARLKACVLNSHGPQASSGSAAILLVSWHGPYKVKDDRKVACFTELVRFVEKLRKKEGCSVAIVGGDFNMDSEHARQRFCQPFKSVGSVSGKVLDTYQPTSDRKEKGMLDYIVYWPENQLESIQTSVLCPRYRREPRNRPFDHNIVLFKFGDAALHTALSRFAGSSDDFDVRPQS
jgi:hypothetical protein